MSQLKLYSMRGSPPSYAVLGTLAALKLPFSTVNIDYMSGEHLAEEHAKRNPQREVPVLEDDDLVLSESVAIMQYLCDQYGGDSDALYPRDPKRRAVVNHRLLFNVLCFYPSVSNYTLGAVFGLEEDPNKLRDKALKALSVFETILLKQNTRFIAGDSVTIADIAVATAALCMKAGEFDPSRSYPTIARWFQTFQQECPHLWSVVKPCQDDLHAFFKNPPPKKRLQQLDELRNK